MPLAPSASVHLPDPHWLPQLLLAPPHSAPAFPQGSSSSTQITPPHPAEKPPHSPPGPWPLPTSLLPSGWYVWVSTGVHLYLTVWLCGAGVCVTCLGHVSVWPHMELCVCVNPAGWEWAPGGSGSGILALASCQDHPETTRRGDCVARDPGLCPVPPSKSLSLWRGTAHYPAPAPQVGPLCPPSPTLVSSTSL